MTLTVTPFLTPATLSPLEFGLGPTEPAPLLACSPQLPNAGRNLQPPLPYADTWASSGTPPSPLPHQILVSLLTVHLRPVPLLGPHPQLLQLSSPLPHVPTSSLTRGAGGPPPLTLHSWPPLPGLSSPLPELTPQVQYSLSLVQAHLQSLHFSARSRPRECKCANSE